MPNTCHPPAHTPQPPPPRRINHLAAVPGNTGAPQAPPHTLGGGWGSHEPSEPPPCPRVCCRGAVPLTPASPDGLMGMIPPSHPPSLFQDTQGPAFPACHVQLLIPPTAPLGCSHRGVPQWAQHPPVPSTAERGPPRAPPAPAPLPHAPLPRRPVLRSRGKSSFKNTSSKAPSVSGGGCRGRGGREGDAAALDTEVTGRGGGRGRRACTWARVCTRVCVHRAPGRGKASPQPPALPQFPFP